MQCRHCGAQIAEDARVCPNCGGSVGKMRLLSAVLLSLGAFIVGCGLTFVIMKDQGVDISKWFKKNEVPAQVATTAPVTPTEQPQAQPEEVFMYEELTRESYTAAAEDPEGQAAKVVAAIDGVELTNEELQSYYWYGVYNFVTQYENYLSYYGYDLTYMGLDVTKPFDQQVYADSDGTWQRVFLENALNEWHKYNALAQQGLKEGYVMSDGMTQQMNKLIDDANAAWKEDGYESLDAMVKAECGPLSSAEGYLAYLKTFHYGTDYFDSIYTTMEPTDAEVETYFAENQATLNFTKDTKEFAVRHILIVPQGGTTDTSGNTTYTDEEWEACRVTAQALLDGWVSGGATEEAFATLANEKSTDPGSNTKGGLYEGLNEETSFVTEFKEWYMDPVRKVGDYGLIKTSYGYHLMYMSAADTVWQRESKALLWQERAEAYVKQCMEAFPMTIHDENIAIGDVKLEG